MIFLKIVGLLCYFRLWRVRWQTHVSHFAPTFVFNYKGANKKITIIVPVKALTSNLGWAVFAGSYWVYFRRSLFRTLNLAIFSSLEFHILVYEGLRDVC